ncbi:hypothetical protein L1987_84980 [Smallanthus sonchifolius]|uniref:Uncharacterized protein n=1 Tax=Smallanthus sonchifolius TaxID=185202 RepID=A0ACB8XV91_9ASTR|nr:hypothetical protein L1987_84980 [Smallanthus sonchifolius]
MGVLDCPLSSYLVLTFTYAGTIKMDKTVEYADGRPEKMKKKSKKNKNMPNDLLLFGDDNNHVETDGEQLKKKKKDKHRDKKRKSESKEDGETDVDHLKKEKRDKHKEKKRKSESKEDGDGDQHDKVNFVNDDLQKKSKKRKRKYSSEKAQIKDNEVDQNAGSDVEKDCDPKPEKKKTDVVKGTGISMKDCPEKTVKNIDEKKKKKKKKKKVDGQNLDTEMNKTMAEESVLKSRGMEDKSMEKQKVKAKGSRIKNKTSESIANNIEKPKAKSKSKSKKVSFSGHVEVFPTSDTQPDKQTTNGDGLVRGKRFTPEEDEIVKQAVLDYVTAKGLGEEGLKMVLNCKSHKGMKKCWKEIGLCIPYRPHTAVYSRAHILFERGEARSWTPEEIDMLKKFHEEHGNDWKKLADELGKHRFHVKDTWRRIKLENLKAGKWSQEEYQNLYDLVNLDLQIKINGEVKKKSKHGMLRDNIPWTAISEKLTTRNDATCCVKWYNQLTSSLVAEKKWCDADDYRMIGALYEMDAACVEDIDWDNVLEHRPGDICLKRWNQMVKHIGDHGSKSFAEQVDILAKRYCPDLAETREDWDNKPVVP